MELEVWILICEVRIVERIFPVEELIKEGLFTNRNFELAFFEDWFKNIAEERSKSQALISPRRLGKTALLERLVNKVFLNEYDVAPFYYSREREVTTLRQFILHYATTFFRQYMAYLLRDPGLYSNLEITLTCTVKSRRSAYRDSTSLYQLFSAKIWKWWFGCHQNAMVPDGGFTWTDCNTYRG